MGDEVTSRNTSTDGPPRARNLLLQASFEVGRFIPLLQKRAPRHRKVVYLPEVTQLVNGKAKI